MMRYPTSPFLSARVPVARRVLSRCGLSGLAILAGAFATTASVVRPYVPDADTLHLWHLNEPTVPVIDVGSDGTHLMALRNGATLDNISFPGFGTALSTFDGGPDAVTDAGRDAYLAARPLVNGPGDNVLLNYTGPNGAFTFEAMIRVDFDPAASCDTNFPGSLRGNLMQIINLDADESSNRVCELCLAPIGLLNGNTNPLLEFVNLNRETSPQSITAVIPLTGLDAIRSGAWFHVAVSYDGKTNQPDNLKLYWTLVDPARTRANLIGSACLLNPLPSGCAPDFALGQTGRQSPAAPYPNQNFVGLIDEVRISGVARAATQMLFESPTPVLATAAASSSDPAAPPAGAPPSSTSHSKPAEEERGAEKSVGTNWVTQGVLVVIAGFLAWVIYMLRRLVFGAFKDVQSARAVVKAATAGAALETPAATEPAKPNPAEPGVLNALPQNRNQPPASISLPPGRPTPPGEAAPASTAAAEDGPIEDGFRGLLRKVGLDDLIQLECMNGKSSVLEIANEKLKGRIYIEEGQIVHAVADNLSGEAALHKLLLLRGGEFTLKPTEAPERRSINGPWMQLLMEAAQLRDETNFVNAEPEGLSFLTSTSSPQEILAMATLLGDHPHVQELVVVAVEGHVVYSAKCSDTAARAAVCGALVEAAKAVATQLPLGEFHHLEVLTTQARTVIQPAHGHHLLIATPNETPATPA